MVRNKLCRRHSGAAHNLSASAIASAAKIGYAERDPRGTVSRARFSCAMAFKLW
jgi:hypothetical protein